MSRNNDYKDKKVVDATNLLPDYIKTDLLEGISDNLFNRFLTKKDFENVNGYVGKLSPDATLNRIPESTEFKQSNQLQPIIKRDVGSETDFMTFAQLLKLLKQSGVDVDNFDDWGKLLQFNFFPPIDIDKIINFQNYYWNDSGTAPEYVTIKNEKNRSNARYEELKRSLFNIIQNGKVTSSVQSIVDNESDGLFIAFDIKENTRVLLRKSGNSVTNLDTDTPASFSETFEYVQLSFNPTINSSIELSIVGNSLENLPSGYIISLFSSENGVQELAEVDSAIFYPTTNTTVITLKTALQDLSYITLSLHPLLITELDEYNYFCDVDVARTMGEINVFGLGQSIWCKNKLVHSSIGDTSLMSSEFTDATANFNSILSTGTDYKIANKEGVNRGIYDITGYTNTTLTVDNKNFFSETSQAYDVFIENDLFSNVNPLENDFWFDENADVLYQRVGGSWVAKVLSFGQLYSRVNDIDHDSRNDWSNTNEWIHKNQLSSLSLARQAEIPIIEYETYLELSEFSNVTYNWEYSGKVGEEYIKIEDSPNLFEIKPVELDTSTNVQYMAPNRIRLPESSGNMVPHINPADKIVLVGFNSNDGVYTVDTIDFIQPSPNQRYITEITILESFFNMSDSPPGAMIHPQLTSQGDVYNSNHDHWKFNGVKDITPNSITGAPNPMLSNPIQSYYTITMGTGESYQTMIGLYYQEFKPTSTYSGARIELASDLQDLCLFEDYQEGDIRVYINGKRIYNRFDEGTRDQVFVSHIVFDSDFEIGPDDFIRIELGEYLLEDIGKKNVQVLTDYTESGSEIERYNLSDNRKIEQVKTSQNQYPYFKLYDVFGSPSTISNPIFWFKEDSTTTVNQFLLKRVATKRTAKDFIFEHGLMEEDGRLLCYKDLTDNIVKSIWRRGDNYEQDVPQQLDSEWDITNAWYYNMEHRLEKDVSLVDLFRHFKTIQMAQSDPALTELPENTYHGLEKANPGVGGTIKEHNGNLDLLASMMFSRSVNLSETIEFAGERYNNLLYYVERLYLNSLEEFLTGTKSVTDLISIIENDTRLDRLFGDSTSKFNGKGIQNFIATSSVLRLNTFNKPLLNNVFGKWVLLHHDGHRSTIDVNNANKKVAFKKITDNEQVVSNSSDAFPATSGYSNGDYLVRGVKLEKTLDLYQLQSSNWVKIDINEKIANVILTIEESLYEACEEIAKTIDVPYDVDWVTSNTKFNELEYTAFNDYYCNNEPLKNTSFNSADPFTWNYAYTELSNNPVKGDTSTDTKGSWQALYELLFGTPYPHLEPWALQGYLDKPDWWDAQYLNTNTTNPWTWLRVMWANILDGIVPVGEVLPNGQLSTGASDEAESSYDFLPVNITNNAVNGVAQDEIVPPYWDGSYSPDVNFKPLFDKSNQEFIRTPRADFIYGQNGYNEWNWRNSINYIHTRIAIAFKLDPIEFFSKAYGDRFVSVDCLLVDENKEKVVPHGETLFHGQEGSTGTYISHGLQQWLVHHNRYKDLDGGSSLYRDSWKEWELRLGYVFDSFINDKTLRVSGDTIDITEKDYSIDILKDNTEESNSFSAIKSIVKKLPSRFISTVYDSKDWVFDILAETPSKQKRIKIYHPENYEFRQLSNSEFAISSYILDDADIDEQVGFWKATYNDTLALNTVSELNNNVQYQAAIQIDGGSTQNVSINGSSSSPPTIEVIITALNSQLNGANVVLESGSILIKSENQNTGVSAVNVTSGNLFSSIASGIITNSGLTDLEFNRVLFVSGNQFQYFKKGDVITVTSSTNYTGSYTVEAVSYSTDTNQTAIKVEEDVAIGDTTVDGIVSPQNAITLPWETGQEVYLDTDQILPTGLSKTVPYFIIKDSDFVFRLAESQEDAANNDYITVSPNGVGCFWVGNLLSTFKPLGGDPDHAFRRHEPDTRTVHTHTGRVTVSRLQNLVDFILGYKDYLESSGIISENERVDNLDDDTGRANDWQLEIEKYISWANRLLVTNRPFAPEIEAQVNVGDDSFSPITTNIFTNGDKVSIGTDIDGGIVPLELKSGFNTFIPFHVIVTVSGNIQLAYTKQDAEQGRAIPFNSGSGIINIKAFEENKKHPIRILNPYKSQFTVKHDRGLLETYTKVDTRMNVFENQNLYNSNLVSIPPNEVLFYRKDQKSKVMLTEESSQVISGGQTSFIEVSHVCHFNGYSTGDKLIYDPFLGINTPRVFLEFIRPTTSTGRPTVSGLVLNNSSLIDSIEKSIEDIRVYYDPYKTIESDRTAKEAKKSVGYQGPHDYMLDLDINEKSQFIFWKSFIQNKGTNKSLAAFTNQKFLDNISVDEYWAYRLCEFGDASRKAYPEIKLNTNDVVKKELRLEFTPPTGGVIGKEHTVIRLTDVDRWNNLPDVLQLMEPYDGYFFDSKITEVFEDVENLATEAPFQTSTAYKFIRFSAPVYGAIVTYEQGGGVVKEAKENLDYRLTNSRVIEFTADDFDSWENVKVAGVSYAYDEENPLRLIETKRPEKVIQDIPVWNPALGQHNPLGEYPIDIRNTDDPAKYNEDLNTDRLSSNHWNTKHVGKVWADTSRAYYKPYYDEKVFSEEDTRSLLWGELEDFGDVKLYKWVESDLSPEEYIARVQEDADKEILLSEKVTGAPRRTVYKNVGTVSSPVWEEELYKVSSFPLAGYDSNSDTDMFDLQETINVYRNGTFAFSFKYTSIGLITISFNLALNSGLIERGDIITLVREPHEPTEQELEDLEYTIVYPHTKVRAFNNNSRTETSKYYFWVSDIKSEKLLRNQSLTLFDAEREYKTMNSPYAIIDGFRYEGVGYGILFGSTFDPEGNNLPTRFSQCTIKGLSDTVKDNSNYILRLTKDFTLRDRMNKSNMSLQNKHWSWKLIRKNSSGPIDRLLWKKVIEAATGRVVISDNFDIDADSELPIESRVRYDALVEGATSRIGLYNGRVMMDKQEIIDLTLEILFDPNREWQRVDIEEFVNQYDFTRTEGIKDFYKAIYESFLTQEINDIFFELLERSVALNKKHPDFFKTSWVSVDVANKTVSNEGSVLDVVKVFPSEFECGDENIVIEPVITPTPSPSVSLSASVTPTPTPTPSVSSSADTTPTPTPTPSSGDGGITPPGESQLPSPTPTPTPSSSGPSGVSTIFISWEN